MKKNLPLLLLALILAACSPAAKAPEAQEVSVFATPAAQPWLEDLYTCAGGLSITVNLGADPAEIRLQVGEPAIPTGPAYKIGEEEILVATSRVSPLQNIDRQQAQDLFVNGDPSLQLWAFSADSDLQAAFNSLVMDGRSVTSTALVAADPQQMSDALNAGTNAAGILPAHWKAGTLRSVFSAGTMPVLALTQESPSAAVTNLVACLQK